jgi:glycosyltransferase involved in cell wall biosynthesis
MKMELTILMPCLNEAETLKSCIAAAQTFLTNNAVNGEILIADNNSNDGSQALAESQGARVVTTAVRGYGAVLQHGIAQAKGRYIIMGDADGSYDFLNLMPFLNALRAGNDLVIGNRFQGGIKQGAMPFLNRYLGNPVLSFIARLFFNSTIRDFHCGLRGFNREAILELNLQTSGMEFASEMIVKATLRHLKITEAPTILSPDGRSRPPHLKPWRDGWRHLKLLFVLHYNR